MINEYHPLYPSAGIEDSTVVYHPGHGVNRACAGCARDGWCWYVLVNTTNGEQRSFCSFHCLALWVLTQIAEAPGDSPLRDAFRETTSQLARFLSDTTTR